MIVVTGAAGFIGSNVVAALNRNGETNILAVDTVSGDKASNLMCLQYENYVSPEQFLKDFCETDMADTVDVVFHEGGCSSTVEQDENFLKNNNYDYSRKILDRCLERDIVCQYASSAGVYGHHKNNAVDPKNEEPLTAYAKSKLMIDNYLRSLSDARELMGLRYFNVYGPGEAHKGFMRSTPLVFDEQLRQSGKVKVFGANNVCAAGEHRRDFIHIDDLIDVKLWLWQNPTAGILNIGTGRSRTFMEVAQQVIAYHGHGEVEFIPFPEKLGDSYQNHTEADMSGLRELGYKEAFMPIEDGIARYLEWTSRSESA